VKIIKEKSTLNFYVTGEANNVVIFLLGHFN